MKKIIPITDLRKTNELSDLCHRSETPIHITKNGYSDLVIMSEETYARTVEKSAQGDQTSGIEDFGEKDDPTGFIKVSAVSMRGKIGQVDANAEEIVSRLREAYSNGSRIIVFPELSLTSYTCGDLFQSDALLQKIDRAIAFIGKNTADIDAFYAFGAPMIYENKLYNCAICMHKGEILGVVAKTYIPEYNEFYEKRYFHGFEGETSSVRINGKIYPFGNNLLFVNKRYPSEVIGVEICEDLWVNRPRASVLSDLGATIICNLSASNETLYKESIRRDLVRVTAMRSLVGYVYCSSSPSESGTDAVFSGHCILSEPDGMLNESDLFSEGITVSEIDIDRILIARRVNGYQKSDGPKKILYFACALETPKLTRKYAKTPFSVPEKPIFEKVNEMQACALMNRLTRIHCTEAVIGVSGGLDSTIALLAVVRAFDKMNLPCTHIHALTLPCFGTTKRTKDNATKMCEKLGVSLTSIDIRKAVMQHLGDLNIDPNERGVAYENAQARERTQVLMDYANQIGGIVVGTGDLSEIALGWSTYNGDHMSMYNVNCSLSKTMIRQMVREAAEKYPDIADYLLDIAETPVSPELLPPDQKGGIAQITEDAVGPYELNDFFLYHFVYRRLSVRKVYFIALNAFSDQYSKETIKKWLSRFLKRFFTHQFKRSCSPDGPKISEVSLSPRSDLRLPSDMSAEEFIRELDEF